MTVESFTSYLESLRASPFLPLFLLGAFLIAGALFLSVWLVILQTGILLSPPLSFAIALAGAVLSSSTFFFVGRLAKNPIRARFGERRAFQAMAGARLEHIVALRVLPVLPFTLVNMSAGALGVPFRTFLLGTVAGMAPGIFALTFFADRARDVFVHPTIASVAGLIAAALVLVGVGAGMRRLARGGRAGRRQAP